MENDGVDGGGSFVRGEVGRGVGWGRCGEREEMWGKWERNMVEWGVW